MSSVNVVYNSATGERTEIPLTQEEIDAREAVASAPTPYPLYRSVFIARQTNEEAGILEAALQQAEPKLRQMFYAVEYFMSDDPLFAVLHWTVTLALSEARADELLAPEE